MYQFLIAVDNALEQKYAQLQRELLRKEKALAEAAALLVLQKKFQALFAAVMSFWFGSRQINKMRRGGLMRHVTEVGLNLIKRFEGFSPTIYICPAGYPTIGYGHVVLAHEQDQFATGITQAVVV